MRLRSSVPDNDLSLQKAAWRRKAEFNFMCYMFLFTSELKL